MEAQAFDQAKAEGLRLQEFYPGLASGWYACMDASGELQEPVGPKESQEEAQAYIDHYREQALDPDSGLRQLARLLGLPEPEPEELERPLEDGSVRLFTALVV